MLFLAGICRARPHGGGQAPREALWKRAQYLQDRGAKFAKSYGQRRKFHLGASIACIGTVDGIKTSHHSIFISFYVFLIHFCALFNIFWTIF